MTADQGIDVSAPPSGTGCVECDAAGGWWFHLRRCAPGEDWFWSFAENRMYSSGPELAPPEHHPLDQPVPGPAGRVPPDWRRHLH